MAPGLHTAGSFSPLTLKAIARAAGTRTIRHSVETGSGASTLLFSHMSEDHTVFAMDAGSGSITNVRRSPLLRSEAVTFVEGPTQVTLPQYRFTEKLQAALIDGPHAYPFPDLEYYYLYPRLEPGALLIVDDIQIPTVHNLFQFLRREAMFELEEVVATTAFFTRTSAPTFDPLGDGWQLQKYNDATLWRYTWREKLRRRLPTSAQKSVVRMRRSVARGSSCRIEILAPDRGSVVFATGIAEGSADLPANSYLWVLVRRTDFDGWWPQAGGAVKIEENRWRVPVNYGGPQDAGHEFEIAALVVGQSIHDLWRDWVARVKETGEFPPVRLPQRQFVLGEAYRTVKKGGDS